MAEGMGKIRLLAILDLLKEFSDEEHPLSSTDLIQKLEEAGIPCDRKAIYRDIAALTEWGADIMITHSPKQGYFIATREFSIPEIRLLMDAVSTAPFITTKKTKELLHKFSSFMSKYQAETLFRQIYIEQRIKFENEEIYYTIDAIHNAITAGKKISFQYYHQVITGNTAHLDDGREFTISPYALVWANDRYYLVGNYEKYDTVSNYRLDRMKHVEMTKKNARPFSEVSEYRGYFDTADYLKKTFNMYSGQPQEIELQCELSLLEIILDKFGRGIRFLNQGEGTFRVKAEVYVSEGLVEWLLQYGARIVVLAPTELRNHIAEEIECMYQKYQTLS